jgi:hypothetical protein|tara:strand:+ start:2281 stop:2511 length:231 start_codon:yes stop_codon:yes gene_type:complete
MPADVKETVDQDELLGQFKERYNNLVQENNKLSKQIKDNEATALKLLGAIETLEYLNPSETTEETAPEETPAAADA